MVRGAWFTAAMGSAAGSLAYAGQAAPTQEDQLRALKELITRQAEELEAQRQALEIQRRRLEELETRVNAGTRPVVRRAVLRVRPPPDCVNRRCKVLRTAEKKKQERASQTQRAQAEEVAPTQPAEPERRPEILTGIAERGGILTPTGTLVVEPSVEYIHDSSDRIVIEGFAVLPAILIGSIDVRRVDRDTVIGSITVRYGITDRIEVDAKVPYVYRNDTTLAREIAVPSTAAEVTDVSGHGVGDVQFGAHYQINRGTGGWPYFIGNLRVKAPTGKDPFEVDVNEAGLQTELPTGTGFWGIEPSMTFIHRSDPVVLWGNVKYLWNVERDIGDGFGTIDPGDAVGATVGIGFGVNPDTSFSLGWEHQFVFDSKQDGRTIEGTNLQLGSFLLGLSYRLSPAVRINLTFQAGVTDDATDTRMLLRVPIRFSLL